MVLIIDGEIVADDDPRAKAARAKRAAPSQPQATPNRPTGANIRTQAQGATQAGGGLPALLEPLETALGVQNQRVTVPAIWKLPARDVPMIGVILLGAASLFLGWRVLAIAAVLHIVSGLSDNGGDASAGSASTRR